MAAFDRLAYRDPSPRPWLVAALSPIVRHGVLPAIGIRHVDLPAADLARLRSVVNRDHAAFLGPNHPEFMTDWMIDKELSRRLSPLMAHWATYEIVNGSPLAQAFWLSNNLVANAPGGGGKAYSVRWAITGHGVLLHPEGTATWQAERVAPLLPGIVDMAWDAAQSLRERGESRPVRLVPLVWRYVFGVDVTRGLGAEMAVIERALQLPSGARLDIASRFAAMLRGALVRQGARLGLPALDTDDSSYFSAQACALAALRAALEARHGALDQDVARAQHQLRRAIRERAAGDPEGARADRARLAELQRLAGLDPALYGRETLSQEQIAECLKRTRSSLLVRGFANAMHNTVPVAVGPRTAHVRAAEPVAVDAHTPAGVGGDMARAALLQEHRRRLQDALDALAREIAPRVDPFRHRNPLRAA